jgi:hypothetical protein
LNFRHRLELGGLPPTPLVVGLLGLGFGFVVVFFAIILIFKFLIQHS